MKQTGASAPDVDMNFNRCAFDMPIVHSRSDETGSMMRQRDRRDVPAPEGFSTNWFITEVRPLWEKHLLPLSEEIHHYLEVGVGEGQSMLWVLQNLVPSIAVGIDDYRKKIHRHEQRTYDRYRRTAEQKLKAWITDGTLQLMIADSRDVLRWYDAANLADGSFDLVYVDGDHRAAPALTDMVLAWYKLRIGGIMVLDDYHKRWQRGQPWTHEAIDAFLHGFETLYSYIWRGERQIGIVRKK